MAVQSNTIIPPPPGETSASTTQYVKITGLTAASVDSIYGAATKVFIVKIDAKLNTGEDVYFKGYASAAPTVGTTAADLVLKGRKGAVTEYLFPGGVVIATDFSVACTQEAGGGAGTTSPSGTVDVEMILGSGA